MDQKPAAAVPSLNVESLMTADVRVVSPEMTIREAIVLLTKHKISGAPIADLSGHVVSVITEGDLLRLAAGVGLETKIGWCLQKLPKAAKLVTLARSSSFSDAYKIFLTRSIHRIIIVDGTGKLQGIVSRSNILRVLCAAGTQETASTDAPKKADENTKEVGTTEKTDKAKAG
jgi:predicted transcriptional regulator